jgi:dTDP-4-amino-4,6-dideoxygalactose transaminase
MTTTVPFLDLGRVTEASRVEIDAAVARVLDSGHFILGDAVAAFEHAFGEAFDVPTAVGVGSGTDAIEVALRVLGIAGGDEVVTQANTCPPTVAAIARIGAVPVLCDVESESARMDPASLEASIGAATRAIVPVHLYGQCADMAAISAIAAHHGLPIVEDCAQAHLSTFEGRMAGTIGSVGCFSFYPTKNLGALGDGGMVISSDPELAGPARDLRQYSAFGEASGYGFGTNSRLDEVQAAILLAKLPHLCAWTKRRSAIAEHYRVALDELAIRPLTLDPRGEHVYHLFVARASDRNAVREQLQNLGVETLVHYPKPIHKLRAYANAVRTPVDLHRSERLAAEVFSLPLYPQMTDAEVETVASALIRCGAKATT